MDYLYKAGILSIVSTQSTGPNDASLRWGEGEASLKEELEA